MDTIIKFDHIIITYSIFFIISFFLINIYLKRYKNFSIKKNLKQQNERWGNSSKSHLGGISFSVCALIICTLIIFQNTSDLRGITDEYKSFIGIFFVIILTTVVGIIDEKESLKPLTKIYNQIIICSILIWAGYTINLTSYLIFDILFTLAWLMFFLNAVNLFDNVDAALTSYSLALFSFFLIISINIDMNPIFIYLQVTYIASLSCFLIFNSYPSKLFMGEIGSLQLASVLAALSIKILWSNYEYINMYEAIYSLALNNIFYFIIFFDVVLISLLRHSEGKNIFKGDTNHLSHMFIRIGFNPNIFSLFMFIINVIAFFIFLKSETLLNSQNLLNILAFYISNIFLLGYIYNYGKKLR